MSTLKFFRLHDDRAELLAARAAVLESELHALLDKKLEDLLGVQFVEAQWLFKPSRERADVVGLDQSNRPVIIEYKRERDEKIIKQARRYRRLLKQEEHRYKFETRIRQKLSLKDPIDWQNMRVICIAAEFDDDDIDDANEQNYLELIRYQLLEEGKILVLEWVGGEPPKLDSPPPVARTLTQEGDCKAHSDFGLSEGMVLEREYNGKNYQVHVVPNGFSYEREFFRALTPIAKKITRQNNLSGPRFFRLTPAEPKSPPKLDSPSPVASTQAREGNHKSHPDYGLSEEKVLKREYKGRNYQVSVVPNGFLYEGEFFRALTPIAKKITSYEAISGPDFFGVKREPQNQTERSEMPISGNLQALSDKLQSYLKNLGGDVREIPSPQHTKSGNYIDYQCNGIIFAKLGARPDMVREQWVRVYLNLDPDSVKLIEGFARDMRYRKGESFQEGERRLQLTVRTMDDVERAKSYIHRAYEEAKQ